ncbi:MAG: hypothetical protein LBH19_00095 [Dysgonamonadaceae bacterium]|jgi:hypothetical protein|nr:hypothetical protein [Dysgonamonadaceae bacterium]
MKQACETCAKGHGSAESALADYERIDAVGNDAGSITVFQKQIMYI